MQEKSWNKSQLLNATEFNDEQIGGNQYTFGGDTKKDYLPHEVTINEFLERVHPEELDEGYRKKNDYYLSRCYNRGKSNELTKYHRSMLEAKLYLGNNLVCSMASETIQNSGEYINQGEEKVKQDCESKAFVRLAERIKKRFPRFPIIIMADGLYVSQRVLQICMDYGWEYIIRYKEGCASSIASEYRALPEKEKVEGNIEHACSWNEQAQKNHYLMEQIADFIKQLYEYFYLKKNEIRKLQKIYLLNC